MFCSREQDLPSDIYFNHTFVYTIANHWHEHYEIIIVKYGEIDCFIESETRPVHLCSGDMLLIRPFVLHSPMQIGNTKNQVFVFSFKEHYMPDIVNTYRFLEPYSSRYACVYMVHLPEEERQLMLKLTLFLQETHNPLSSQTNTFVWGYISLLLGLFEEYGVLHETFIKSEEESKQHINIRIACSYIKEHLSENICEDDISKLVNYSTSHFTRLFKKIVGCTVKRYIDNLKIRETQRLLILGSFSVTEISYRLGFSHPNNLGRTYKRITGKSLREDKKQLK